MYAIITLKFEMHHASLYPLKIINYQMVMINITALHFYDSQKFKTFVLYEQRMFVL